MHARKVDYSVVPFENSTNGQVVFTYDLLRDWYLPDQRNLKIKNPDEDSFKIVSEQFVSVHHNLLTRAKSIDQIKKVYSHPQAWGQIQKFMKERFPQGVAQMDTDSTAKAAEIVAEDETGAVACVSSMMSSKLYNLPVMFQNIENFSNNCTRFLVLGYEAIDNPIKSEDNHATYLTSLVFTLPNDNSGALVTALDTFYKFNISLSAINTRPSSQQQWLYVFFVEFKGSTSDQNVLGCLERLRSYCSTLVVMGSFRRASESNEEV